MIRIGSASLEQARVLQNALQPIGGLELFLFQYELDSDELTVWFSPPKQVRAPRAEAMYVRKGEVPGAGAKK